MISSAEQVNTNKNSRMLSWSSLDGAVYLKAVLAGVLLIMIFREDLQRVVHRWMSDSSWSHGFLIPLFSLYLLNQKKKEILSSTFKPNYLGLVFMIICLIVYPLNIVHFNIGYGNPILFIAMTGSTALFLGGWKLIKYSWLPIAYLVFAVPLPERFYRSLTIPMRKLAAETATIVMNLVPNLDTTANGVVIDVVYKGVKMEPGLDVAEACSGMRLLMAFAALGVAMAYIHYRPIWQRIILLLSTIPIAILCNIVRVTVTGFIYILWDPKYAQGVYHDALGMMMLPLAFLMYWSLAWFMDNLFEEETNTAPQIITRQKKKEGLSS